MSGNIFLLLEVLSMYWNNKSFRERSSILLPKLFSLKIFKLSGSYNNDDILGDKYDDNEEIQENQNKNEIKLDDKKEILNIKNEENNIIIENNIDLKQSIKLTNKSRFSEKLSNNFDLYFSSYNDNFINI